MLGVHNRIERDFGLAAPLRSAADPKRFIRGVGQEKEMIGLKRHTVLVVDHDPGWIDLGTDACRRVQQAGGDLVADVQHVGSTAVPELPAKPILDLAAAVATLDVIPKLIEKLTALGYIYRGNGEHSGGHLFVWESEPDVRTIHLHVVTRDDVQWRNYLRFRDLLRQDSTVRQQYAELKRELRKRFPDDRKAYTDSKDEFIRGTLKTTAQPEVATVPSTRADAG
jgi:GrpB-like predicted nucleotidyltransferase (UPF0157 family)